MKWFKETFLKSFEIGKELRISEKQFRIFEKYLKESPLGMGYDGKYIFQVEGKFDDLKLKVVAYEWFCVGKHQFFVKINKQL